MDTFLKILDFLKGLIELLTGKSHGDPKIDPDHGTSATTQESKIETVHSKIDSGPSGAVATDDGGINFDNFNK
jgi:hypothetical protein